MDNPVYGRSRPGWDRAAAPGFAEGVTIYAPNRATLNRTASPGS